MDTGDGVTVLEVQDSMVPFKAQFFALTADDQLTLLSEQLIQHADRFYQVAVPKDYLQSSLNAISIYNPLLE